MKSFGLQQKFDKNNNNIESLNKQSETLKTLQEIGIVEEEFLNTLANNLDEINVKIAEIIEAKEEIIEVHKEYNTEIINLNEGARKFSGLTSMRAANDPDFSAAA